MRSDGQTPSLFVAYVKIEQKVSQISWVLKIIPYLCGIKHKDYARGIQIFRIFIFLL